MRKANEGRIAIHFNEKSSDEPLTYEDTFPEELPTLEDVKGQYGTIVWCKFTKCTWNKQVKGLQRTQGTILKNRTYVPLNEQEAIWPGICTRGEIGIKYDEIRSAAGTKVKVPSCFSAATGVTGHMDFSKLLQSDGSALGGNIDSQNTYGAGEFGMPSGFTPGRERIISYGGQESKSRPTKEYNLDA